MIWDRPEILRTLKKLSRDGADLSYNALAAKNQSLVSAAAYHFGSYRKAVEKAGIDYAKQVDAYADYALYRATVESRRAEPVPMQLRNAPTKAMKQWGYSEGYQHAHNFEDAVPGMECLPPSMAGKRYYEPTGRSLEKRIAHDAPQVDFIKKTEAEWKELAPAMDPRYYPIEVLLHLFESLPSADVRITQFNQSARQISVDGEANSVALVYQFADKVKKNPGLQAFTFDLPQPPRILPNEHAQYRLEGKQK